MSEKKDLIKLLKKQTSSKKKDAIIAILTVIWILPKYLLSVIDGKRKGEISSVYSSFDEFGRNHNTINLGVKSQILMAKNIFGTAQIKSKLLNNLNPLYQLSSHYIEKTDNGLSKKSIYTRNKVEGVPYLAGTSGMANGFCNTLSLLNIGINSSEGQNLEKIMSAFIVGIGFHSFQECYDAFEMTDKYTDMIEIMIDMSDHFMF
ncbi:hypothetical protein FM037_09145 [Shewanella psychropiezotolerans]|uniref:Uncharacterized protein n=1 Tax=Shewanella psychropiezotolerans TaxID=2593655 RepID=A0ABX5WWA1_9GAMM|nr:MULTISPECIES: hypothetical protein [Shewanella]MPY26909.1 hypothetical protein [Shewanella sp. YLB-07]QDO83363.1 hypothetical protein FM037_09145 [Shewanella psychropiezotolerans]